MPEERTSLFDEVSLFDQLERAGVFLTDENTILAIEITANYYQRALKKALDSSAEATQLGRQSVNFARELSDKLGAEKKRAAFNSIVLVLLGLSSAAITILPPGSLEWLSLMVHRLFSMLTIQEAVAQPTGNSTGDMQNYLRFAVFGLLAIAYVVAFLVSLIGPDRSKRYAQEYVKGLTPFFLGAASGKLL